MDPGSKRGGRARPPFDVTLLGVAPEGVSAFDATIALGSETSMTDSVTARGATTLLPTISVDFGGAPRRDVAGTSESIADLRVDGTLGEGGMGVVHLAHQRSLERDVALKTTRLGAPGGAAEALAAEAVLTGCLEHPNIVPVHAFGRAIDGRPVLVMKRLEGVAWKELVRAPDHPLWDTIGSSDRLVDHLQILAQVANALSFAHSRSILHRDVKPENVMIGGFGEVYLVDFGLATRLDAARAKAPAIVGSPAYMAPEMVAGFDVDARTDVYLLGATLHEILTGRPPHAGSTLLEVLSSAYESEPPTFDETIPEELAAVCRRALARDRDERHATAREFRSAIVDFLNHRASLLLSRLGEERLAEAEAGVTDPSARAARRTLLAESRFAHRQALVSWPENAAAREGEQRCLAAEARLAIEEGDVALARSLVASLETRDEALKAAFARLEARVQREREAAEKLRSLAHDLDARVESSTRRRVLVVIAGIASILSAYVLRRSDAGTLTSAQLVPVAGLMVSGMAILILAFRKRLLANAFGRRLTTLAFASSALMLAHRLLAVRAGEPVHLILAFDSFLFGAMMIVAGVTMARFLAFGALFTFAGAVVAVLVPSRAPAAFAVSIIAMLIVAALLWRPETRDREDEP